MGDEKPPKPDVVRVVMLNKNRTLLCMVKKGSTWDLPTFYYKSSISNGHRIDLCHESLEKWFDDSSQCDISFGVELMGDWLTLLDKGEKKESVRVKLWLLDWHSNEETFVPCLPRGAAWKDVKMMGNIMEAQTDLLQFVMLEIARNCMEPGGKILKSLTDPRYKPGWNREAQCFLTETVAADGSEATGRVIQHHVSPTSTILKVSTSRGWYFLKAPALGCNEVRITVELASLFPHLVPSVVSSSQSLNCFISREFSIIPLGVKDLSGIVRLYADLQKASIPHVNHLVNTGCPLRDFDDLVMRIEMWIAGKGINAKRYCPNSPEQLKDLLLVVKGLGEALAGYNIPRTLVHGDFALGNLTSTRDVPIEDGGFLLFDWQFAYIGHPFCDFHRLHKDITEDIINVYLQQWTSFETMERLREAFNRAWKLGWFYRLLSIAEWYDECDPQRRSYLKVWHADVTESLHEYFYPEESEKSSIKSSSSLRSSPLD